MELGSGFGSVVVVVGGGSVVVVELGGGSVVVVVSGGAVVVVVDAGGCVVVGLGGSSGFGMGTTTIGVDVVVVLTGDVGTVTTSGAAMIGFSPDFTS